MKTQSKKKGCSCSLFYYARNREFQFFWRKTVLKRTSNAIQYSAWRKLTWMNCNWKGKLQVTLLSVYVSWKILCSHTFKASSEELTWCILRKKGKIHEGRCVKEFFPLTCRLASRNLRLTSSRSSLPEVFLGKGVQSNQLQSNFIEILLRHEHSSVNLLHLSRTPFSKNTSGWLLLFFTDNFQGF